jgi:vesicle coat complex subunit
MVNWPTDQRACFVSLLLNSSPQTNTNTMDKVQAAMADMFKSRFATSNTSKKGETFELKAELNADTKDKRKEAVKRVISSMTIGKDVSMLFAGANVVSAD